MVVSIQSADHYIWGEISHGWHLLRREDLSVIQERVPAGAGEVMHYHNLARHFFYILEGEGMMVLEYHQLVLKKGEGLEIPPGIKHQFKNQSKDEVLFLVISAPSAKGDRVDC